MPSSGSRYAPHGEEPTTIGVLPAEDTHMIHGAPTALLDPEADIEVVAETARGNAVVPAALAHRAAFAIRRVAAGEHVIDPRLAATALTAEKNPLTARETDVLRPAPAAGLVAGGPATAPGRRPPAVDH